MVGNHWAGGADAQRRFGPLDQGVAHRRQREAFVFAPDDLNHPFGRERFQRGNRRFGDRRDRVIEIAHAIGFVYQLQTVGEAGEFAHRCLRVVPA